MSRELRLANVWILTLAMIAGLFLVACEDSPQDRLREAQRAIASRNADLAEQRLNEALKADPGHFEARRLLAQVDALRGDFAAAEEKLFTLWDAEGLDNETDLDAEGQRNRGLIRRQFNDLYRDWANSINQVDEPDLFEEVAQKGLERDPRNARLNAELADFYQERAERHIERGEKIQAAQELEKIDDLRIFADVRRDTRERARNLRREAFSEEARARFEENVQPELVDTDSYDPENEQIRIAVELTVDRSLDPASDEARQQVRARASQTLIPTLAQLAIALTGLELEEIDLSQLDAPEIGIEDEEFQRGRYQMTATFSLSGLIDMAFGYAEFERTRPHEADDADADDADDDADDTDSGDDDEEAAEGEEAGD